MARWQCFVAVFSEDGGMVCPCTLDSQGGWWDDCTAYTAADMLVNAHAHVRLVGKNEEEKIPRSLFEPYRPE